MIEVPASNDDLRVLAWVASGATASPHGVMPKPAVKLNLVVDNQLLSDAFRVIGNGCIVLDDEPDFLACYRITCCCM